MFLDKLFLVLFDAPRNWQCLFQDPATSIMENIIDLHHDIVFFQILIITFVLWMLVRIFFFFNVSNKNTVRSFDLTHNTTIEIIWTLIPTFILILIALPSYILIYNLDDFELPFVLVKIIGHQWFWSYEFESDYAMRAKNILDLRYPMAFQFDSYMINETDLDIGLPRLLVVDNAVVLPINASVRFLVTASDVIHSWTIPSLGIKMDAVPGRLNQVSTFINREGFFYGQCSELCGINHSFMPIESEVRFWAAYDFWYDTWTCWTNNSWVEYFKKWRNKANFSIEK